MASNPIAHIAFIEGSGSCTRRPAHETLGNFTVLVRFEGLDPTHIAKDPGAPNRDGFRFNVRMLPGQRLPISPKTKDVFVAHPGMTIQSLDWPFVPKSGSTNTLVTAQSNSQATRGHVRRDIPQAGAQPQ